MDTPPPLSRIAYRRRGRKALSLRVLATVADRYVIARDTPHRAGSFCAVVVLDLKTKVLDTYTTAPGTQVYGTQSEATRAAESLPA